MQEELERTNPPTDTQPPEEGAQLPDHKPEEREEPEKDEEPDEPEKLEKPEETDSSSDDSHNGSYDERAPEKPEDHSSSDGEHTREYQKSSRRGAAAPESETAEEPTEPEEPKKPEEPVEANSKPELRQKHQQAVTSSDGETDREYHKFSSRTGALALEDETEEGDDEDTGHQELVPEGGKRQEEEPEAYVVHSSPDTGTTEPAPDAVERARASCKCVLQVRPD